MQVPFYDLSEEYSLIQKDVKQAIDRVLKSQYFILGDELSHFEEEFASYVGTKYCVGVGSGTDGLILALMALGITKGDEVITQANTFIATAYAISIVGAKPVLVDVDSSTHQIDPKEVSKKITKKTKAIIPVHLFGSPAPMNEIQHVAKKHKIKILEDACQAHGAMYKNKNLGTFGDASVFSFYPSKNLGAYGDAGAVCTNNKKIYAKLVSLRNYGQRLKYKHTRFGTNTRLDEIQAAVLRVKLKYLDLFVKKRNDIANFYLEHLENVKTPQIVQDGKSSYHLFVITSEVRDTLKKFLDSQKIFTQIHYPIPVHKNKVYEKEFGRSSFPVSEKLAKMSLSLPLYYGLSQKQLRFVTKTIHSFFS